eukprot:9985920-Karenia_brevis.AAC.1
MEDAIEIPMSGSNRSNMCRSSGAAHTGCCKQYCLNSHFLNSCIVSSKTLLSTDPSYHEDRFACDATSFMSLCIRSGLKQFMFSRNFRS